jgi:type IV pilus assembly protein PilQ
MTMAGFQGPQSGCSIRWWQFRHFSDVGNAGLGSSLTFGRLGIDSTILDLQISALEPARQGKVISTPRVTTLNGQSATISQGTKIPYQSSDDNGVSKTEFVDANLELTVTPEINPDNSIILDINATNSSPTLVDGATAPAIDTKEAKTKLLVRDGETTVIGGIFVEDNSDSESGIPYLRKIPYLGHLSIYDQEQQPLRIAYFITQGLSAEIFSARIGQQVKGQV